MSGELAGQIGPNAITRMAEALEAALGAGRTAELFELAGLADALRRPPDGMVDELDVARLHRVVAGALDGARVDAIAREAGRRTGAYLLAHRIPAPARMLLRALPPGPAAVLLLAAVSRHAWTFAGSGCFRVEPGRPLKLVIEGCPLCSGLRREAPACGYYAATFEHLFAALVSPRTTVRETACTAVGDAVCRFEVGW